MVPIKIYTEGLVSIVTPVYNAERTIEDTITSVINQTYKNWELILIDDNSIDSSFQIIQKYLEIDDRIKYYLLKNNGGAAVARNYGIAKAQGRYLAFLDSDDIWLEQKLEKQLIQVKLNKPFIYTAFKMIDETDKIIKNQISVPQKVTYNYLLRNTVIATSTVLLDREILGEFTMPLRRSGQDYATWLMLLRKIKIAYGIDEVLVLYRKSRVSLSSNKLKSIKQVYSIQIKDENINPLVAIVNTICFCLHAFKKHFIKDNSK